MNRSLFLLMVGCCAVPEATAQAPLKVWVAGGLLGRVGGFCEVHSPTLHTQTAATGQTSCPPKREPFGGMLALSDELAKAAGAGAYSLVAGNNFPKDFAVPSPGDRNASFWQELANAKPQLVALGQDDLLRAMLPAPVPGDTHVADSFAAKIKFFANGWGDLHFLASNVVVRAKRKGVNAILSNGYRLAIDADQSVSWLTQRLAIQLPRAARDTRYAVRLNGAPVQSSQNEQSVNVSVTLKPGTEYAIELVAADAGDRAPAARFHLQTDRALTPWANASSAEPLQGLPVAMLSGYGPPLMVVAVIDPEVTRLVNSHLWESREDGEQIAVLPPDQVAAVLRARAGEVSALPVLMSDLSDSVILRMLRSSSPWRILALNPDSAMLGCQFGAAGCGQKRKQPYSYGNAAVLDGNTEHAQTWVRPEWLGEKIIRIEGEVSGSGWSGVRAEASWVPGFVRGTDRPNVTSGPMRETFVSAAGGAKPVDLPEQKEAAQIWWKNREDVVMVLMEAMRRTTRSEIAIADQGMIDDDVVNELLEESANRQKARISYSQLMEIFWRHDAYVRAIVKGSEVAGLLSKIQQLPADDDGGYCVRGLRSGNSEMGCSISARAENLRVNGRYLESTLMYSIALPQGLAERLGLGDHIAARTDVLSGVFQFLRDGSLANLIPQVAPPAPAAPHGPAGAQNFLPPADRGPAVARPAAPGAVKWRNPAERRWLGMIYMTAATMDIGGQNYSVPAQGNGKPDTSGFAAIPNVGEKVQHTFRFNMSGSLHAVPLDLPWVTVDVSSTATLNRIDTYPTSITGVLQSSFSPDLWSNGVTLRSRWLSDRLAGLFSKTKLSRLRLEPYIGYLDDSSVFHFKTEYQTAASNPKTNTPLYTLGEDDPKPNYAYLAAGFTVGESKFGTHFSVKQVTFEHDAGTNYREPVGLNIGRSSYDMNAVRRCGVQKLIDGGSGCTAAQINGSPTIFYTYQVQRQGRNRLRTTLEFAFGSGGAKKTVTLDLKGNRWNAARQGYTPLDPLWTADMSLKSAFPVYKGISMGPYVRYYFVKAYQSPGTFMSNQYGFALTVPLVTKGGDARFVY